MSKRWPHFRFHPSVGDLGQDSSDDNHSVTHGPPLTSDVPFWPDYQDEGECHLSGFWVPILFTFCPAGFAFCRFVSNSGFSVLVITNL